MVKEVLDKMRDGSYGFLVIPENAEILTYTDEDLRLLNKDNKFKKVYRTEDHIEDEPLFKDWSTSLFRDVRQFDLGECFFDAVILGLISTDRYIVQDMIIDNHDGTCTVRLYDAKLEPKYYRIDKTDFNNQKPTTIFNFFGPPSYFNFHANAPWVCYLEKAYALHRYMENSNKKPLLSYLNGGNTIDVMRAFTGCPQSYDVPNKFIPLSEDEFYFPELSTIYDLKLYINRMESEGQLSNDIDLYVLAEDPTHLDLKKLPFKVIYGYKKCILTYADKLYFYNSEIQAIEEIQKNEENEVHINKILNKIEIIKESNPPTHKIHHIPNIISRYDLRNDFKAAVTFLRGQEFLKPKDILQFLDYLERSYLNKNKYEKVKNIKDIQEDIQKLKDLFVWYNANIANTSQLPDLYNADFMFVKFLEVTAAEEELGIVDGHAYAVLNMYVDESKNEIVLRIVNPWKTCGTHTDEKTGEIVKFSKKVRRKNLSAEFNSPEFFQRRLSVGYMPDNRNKVYSGISELRFSLDALDDKIFVKTFCSSKKTRLLNDLAIFCACIKNLQVCERNEQLKIFIDHIFEIINSSEYSTDYKLLLLMNYINTNKPEGVEEYEINELLDLMDEVLNEINNKVLEEKMDEFDISIFGKIVEDVLNEPDIKELVTDFRERFNGYLKHFDYDSYIAPSA